MPPKKHGWKHKKRRTTTSNLRVKAKERRKIYDERYTTKVSSAKKKERVPQQRLRDPASKRKIILRIKLNEQKKKDQSNQILKDISNTTAPLVSNNVCINYKQAWKGVVNENMHLKQKIQTLQKKIVSLRRSKDLLQRDVDKLVQDSYFEEDIASKEIAQIYKPPLVISSSCSNISILSKSTFDPKFIISFREFIKIRLKCNVLKNSHALNKMIYIVDVYNSIFNPEAPSINLGGTSDSSVNRLMQFRAVQLFQFEICQVINNKWRPNTTATLYHDECSQRNESQLSVVMAFNTTAPSASDYDTPSIYTPKLYEGNVVRALWHRNIPSKEAKTALDWTIIPCIDELDRIGRVLFDENWKLLRSLLKTKLAVMSDQNNGALHLNKLIGDEFQVNLLVVLICFMHNMDNTLKVAIKRLLLLRNSNCDNILKNLRNIDVVDIGNRLQKILSRKYDGHQNKGDIFAVFCSRSQHKDSFVDFRRVVGERKQWEIINLEAALSRREDINLFSRKKGNSGHLTADPRLLYEFSNSVTILKETLSMINLRRMFVEPLMISIAKETRQMNKILPIVKQTLIQMQHTATNKIMAVKVLLTAQPLICHEAVQPHLVQNKLLSKSQSILVIKFIEKLDEFKVGNSELNMVGFLNAVQQILR